MRSSVHFLPRVPKTTFIFQTRLAQVLHIKSFGSRHRSSAGFTHLIHVHSTLFYIILYLTYFRSPFVKKKQNVNCNFVVLCPCQRKRILRLGCARDSMRSDILINPYIDAIMANACGMHICICTHRICKGEYKHP